MEELNPQEMDGEQQAEAVPPQTPLAAAVQSTWFRRLFAVIFVVFCFEVGLFLLVYPWMDAWTDNTISILGRGQFSIPWRQFWNNNYVRGVISGVGILNLWIALVEVVGLFRRRPE